MMIGLKRHFATGANVMQHEDCAGAAEDRPQQMMRAGDIKRFETCADDVTAKMLHETGGRLRQVYLQAAHESLKKRLVRALWLLEFFVLFAV